MHVTCTYARRQASHLQACLDCSGVVIFTGVGKSGLIAQKICQTLVSTGTKAVFLSPQVNHSGPARRRSTCGAPTSAPPLIMSLAQLPCVVSRPGAA